MRTSASLSLALCLGLTLAASAVAADRPMHLTDPKLPLQVIRPLDRHVYVLTLEAKWDNPASEGVVHYVNVLFPNGGVYSHRVVDEGLVRAGEVRVFLPDYALIRNGVNQGGTLTIVVSAGRSVDSADAPAVESDGLEVKWPPDRPIVTKAPRTKYTPREPIDAFVPEGPMPKAPPVKTMPLMKQGPAEKVPSPRKDADSPIKKDFPPPPKEDKPREKLPAPKKEPGGEQPK
jgi:hypothetical protein